MFVGFFSMPYINNEFFKELIKQSEETPAALMIKDPMLFEIEVNGKKSYLLGTHHATPLCRLPSECIMQIAMCKKLFVEEQVITPQEIYDYKNNFSTIFAKQPDDDWFTMLSMQQQELVEIYFQEQVKTRFGIENAPNVQASEISFSLVKSLMVYILQQEIYPLLEFFKDDDKAPENFASMDSQLQSLFCEEAGGLEPSLNYELLISQDSYSEDNIEELKEMLRIIAILRELNDIGDNNKTFNYIKDNHPDFYDDFLEACQEYTSFYLEGDYLRDYSIARGEDAGEASDSSFVNKERNITFFRNIMHFSQTVDCPLFAFGAMHLLGENGLLSLFKQNEIAVKKYSCTENTFKPYNYIYLDMLQFFNAVKQQILKLESNVSARPRAGIRM